MNPDRFDSITRLFTERRLTRRKTLAGTGAGLASVGLAAAGLSGASAQDSATPISPDGTGDDAPTMLFVQSFQSGSIAPKDGVEGRYTATFDHGLGQTIYFSDRPDRIVGAFPTDAFLGWLGFPDDNPPNAAILTDNGNGESTLAVVELFAPVYDPDTATATYEMAVLDHWEDTADLTFDETPVDVGALGASFGTAHLFIDGIDDCPDATMQCIDVNSGDVVGEIPNADHDGYCYSTLNFACLPCQPWDYSGVANYEYWQGQCAERFEGCQDDNCHLENFCSRDAPLGNTLCQ